MDDLFELFLEVTIKRLVVYDNPIFKKLFKVEKDQIFR
jgi:hypothetical protein